MMKLFAMLFAFVFLVGLLAAASPDAGAGSSKKISWQAVKLSEGESFEFYPGLWLKVAWIYYERGYKSVNLEILGSDARFPPARPLRERQSFSIVVGNYGVYDVTVVKINGEDKNNKYVLLRIRLMRFSL